jgi:hypothetical protein
MATRVDAGTPRERTLLEKLKVAPVTPERAMRLRYLPLLVLYWGALRAKGAAVMWVL